MANKVIILILFTLLRASKQNNNCSQIEIDSNFVQISISSLQTEGTKYKKYISELGNIEENILCINETKPGNTTYLKHSLLLLAKQQISESATELQNTTKKLSKYINKEKQIPTLEGNKKDIIQYLHVILSIINLALIITVTTVYIYKQRQKGTNPIQQNTNNELTIRRLL